MRGGGSPWVACLRQSAGVARPAALPPAAAPSTNHLASLPRCSCSFHAMAADQGRMFSAQDPHLQHIEQQYSRAQEGLYDRDREARDVLEGRPSAFRSTPQRQPAASPAGEGVATAPGQAGPSPGGPSLERTSVNSTAGAATRSCGSEDQDDQSVQITRPEGGRCNAGPHQLTVTCSVSAHAGFYPALVGEC